MLSLPQQVADFLHRGIQIAQVGQAQLWLCGVQPCSGQPMPGHLPQSTCLGCRLLPAVPHQPLTPHKAQSTTHDRPPRPALLLLPCSQDCKAKTPAPGKLKEFGAYLAAEGAKREDVQQLAREVHEFASSFAMPGGDW